MMKTVFSFLIDLIPATDKILAGIAAALVAALSVVGWRYRSTLTEFAAYRAVVQAEGARAKAAQDAVRESHETALQTIRNDYEKQIDAVRAGAADNFKRLRESNARGGGVRGTPNRNKMDDGTEPKPLLARTLANCAEDALKLEAWQTLCGKIKCEVGG
jgi:hypothetical protein